MSPGWEWAAAAATASSMVSTRRISGQPSRYWGAAITASWIFWAVLPRSCLLYTSRCV